MKGISRAGQAVEVLADTPMALEIFRSYAAFRQAQFHRTSPLFRTRSGHQGKPGRSEKMGENRLDPKHNPNEIFAMQTPGRLVWYSTRRRSHPSLNTFSVNTYYIHQILTCRCPLPMGTGCPARSVSITPRQMSRVHRYDFTSSGKGEPVHRDVTSPAVDRLLFLCHLHFGGSARFTCCQFLDGLHQNLQDCIGRRFVVRELQDGSEQ